MKPSVFVETSVLGYLTSWPSTDPLVLARQMTTKKWWSTTSRFSLFVSELVLQECSRGDEDAARERLQRLDGIPVLSLSAEVDALATALLRDDAVPLAQADDAVHIATAAVHRINYLVSWNFRHIVNASRRSAIEAICAANGYPSAGLCTPEQLMEISDHG